MKYYKLRQCLSYCLRLMKCKKDLNKIIDHFLEDKGSDIAGREKMKNERQTDIQTDKEKRERDRWRYKLQVK